tara:strand:+ start:454 stop:1515 length:1062 start_codon:yes stop_codon:yes gene_type:complete
MREKILISTGGSGGHVIPATILHDHLLKKKDVFISTDNRGYKYLDKDIHKILIINTPKLTLLSLPLNFFKILFLLIKSFLFLKKEKINQLISTGGYMSLPLILAGKFLNLKIYLFEPNLVLGRANKFFLNSCEKIFCYTDQIKNFPNKFKNKIVVIHPLVRDEFYKIKKSNPNDGKFHLLVVGGSQGASIFDKNLKKIILNISKKFSIKIIQQTHVNNIYSLKEFYNTNNIENEIFNYDKNFIEKIAKSDVCITRAGATTLAELSILNVPFIAVPLPNSKDNHQFENANFYLKNNCCWVLEQNVFDERIEQLVTEIIQNKSNYNKKKENLNNLNCQNNWINVNQKILDNLYEN